MKKSLLFFCLSVIFLLSRQDNKWENEIRNRVDSYMRLCGSSL